MGVMGWRKIVMLSRFVALSVPLTLESTCITIAVSPPEAYVGDNATAFAKIIVDMTRTGLYFQGQHHFAGAVSKYDPEGKLTAVSKAMRRGFWVSADLLLVHADR